MALFEIPPAFLTSKKMASHHLAGILVVGYFYLIPQGVVLSISLLNSDLTDNSLLTLSMILLLFFMLLLYLILTLAIVLLNRRFPFDRLAGAEYESTVRVKKDPKG